MSRRKHSKVLQLPEEIVEAVNKQLTSGIPYRDIADAINKLTPETGIEVSHMAVQRYGKDFLGRLERLKIVNEQAKAIIDSHGDGPDTALSEAANKMALSIIMETLLSAQNSLEGESLTAVMRALAQLQRSSIASEKLKFQFDKGVSKAVAEVRAGLQEELKNDPDLHHRLLEKLSQVEANLLAAAN
ncbi:phage protein Gp27 family protein [Cohnella nanjingensis]|uniref:DUF3486 family protein n=1 Tax=Cohnella nanjingensis TaxID=1387779 RepID=A0A7X0RV87_9BACL|nr:phage protein Gp27 family protein [Cohnella nanjingensis]MBB6673005.1 DUF3486 family protein [Cohnella nanjingensis]